MRVIVTRPQAQAVPFVARLRALGLAADALPLIEISPAPDAAAVRSAWAALPDAAFVMFVSPNAVEQFFTSRPASMAWPTGLRAGCTGPGTSAALRAHGVPDEAICEPPPGGPFDSEGLWALIKADRWPGRTAWIVRGEGGRDWLADRLRAAGATVHFVAAYARRAPRLDDGAQALLAGAVVQPKDQVWHFSSSEAVANLQALMPHADWSSARAQATHPRIADAARAAGFGTVELVGLKPEHVQQALAAGA